MSATSRGEQIRIPKAAELVADTLRRRIITGDYEVNELLPPESTLMANFNVARTTIRDAVRILESEGLLVVRRVLPADDATAQRLGDELRCLRDADVVAVGTQGH